MDNLTKAYLALLKRGQQIRAAQTAAPPTPHNAAQSIPPKDAPASPPPPQR